MKGSWRRACYRFRIPSKSEGILARRICEGASSVPKPWKVQTLLQSVSLLFNSLGHTQKHHSDHSSKQPLVHSVTRLARSLDSLTRLTRPHAEASQRPLVQATTRPLSHSTHSSVPKAWKMQTLLQSVGQLFDSLDHTQKHHSDYSSKQPLVASQKSESVPFLPAPSKQICERSVPPITLRKNLRAFRSSYHPPQISASVEAS